jgi:hypothetical protein
MTETTNTNSLRHRIKNKLKFDKQINQIKEPEEKSYMLRSCIAVSSKAISEDGFNKMESTEMCQVASPT